MIPTLLTSVEFAVESAIAIGTIGNLLVEVVSVVVVVVVVITLQMTFDLIENRSDVCGSLIALREILSASFSKSILSE